MPDWNDNGECRRNTAMHMRALANHVPKRSHIAITPMVRCVVAAGDIIACSIGACEAAGYSVDVAWRRKPGYRPTVRAGERIPAGMVRPLWAFPELRRVDGPCRERHAHLRRATVPGLRIRHCRAAAVSGPASKCRLESADQDYCVAILLKIIICLLSDVHNGIRLA